MTEKNITHTQIHSTKEDSMSELDGNTTLTNQGLITRCHLLTCSMSRWIYSEVIYTLMKSSFKKSFLLSLCLFNIKN